MILAAARNFADLGLVFAGRLTADDYLEATFRKLNDHNSFSLRTYVGERLKRRLECERVVSICEYVLRLLSYRQWKLSETEAAQIESHVGGTRVSHVSAGLPTALVSVVEASRFLIADILPSTMPTSSVTESSIQAARAHLDGAAISTSSDDDSIELSGDEEDLQDLSESLPFPAFGLVDNFARCHGMDLETAYLALLEASERYGPGNKNLADGVEDFFMVMILRLFGHRWPGEASESEAVGDSVDNEGIIPISDGTGRPTLLARIRDRLAEDFGVDRVNTISAEFAKIVGQSLEVWLMQAFFRQHALRFKKQ